MSVKDIERETVTFPTQTVMCQLWLTRDLFLFLISILPLLAPFLHFSFAPDTQTQIFAVRVCTVHYWCVHHHHQIWHCRQTAAACSSTLQRPTLPPVRETVCLGLFSQCQSSAIHRWLSQLVAHPFFLSFPFPIFPFSHFAFGIWKHLNKWHS